MPCPTPEHIEQDLLSLPEEQVEELYDWLGELLDSHEKLKPEFIAVIEPGKAEFKS